MISMCDECPRFDWDKRCEHTEACEMWWQRRKDEEVLQPYAMPDIKSMRKAKGLTQDALAKRCEMTQQQISWYETGARLPKYQTLMRILQALEAV